MSCTSVTRVSSSYVVVPIMQVDRAPARLAASRSRVLATLGHFRRAPILFALAEDFAENHHAPIMVLPDGESAGQYRWPSDGMPALIHERGEYNDDRLDELAGALLRAGSPSVVAIREALLDDFDPRVFYDPEVIDVAA